MLTLAKISKTFGSGSARVQAVQDISWDLAPGSLAVVYGRSGSGKSTLLMMMGGMLTPSAGRICFQGENLYDGGGRRLRLFRRQSVGFIFQRFHLLPYFNIHDNIALTLSMRGRAPGRAAIRQIAGALGLADRMRHFPSELSAGEQQRVALAQALAGDPDIILADEPTGNLDRGNARLITGQLRAAADAGKIVVAATHDARLLQAADRRLLLEAGQAAPDNLESEERLCGQ
ncbi:MAG: ABC transporter ATP-binding protein [Kiritimatiellia bacterium]|nr:ABC transporter ATP-binding protein [Lentisphaerota bacterium]